MRASEDGSCVVEVASGKCVANARGRERPLLVGDGLLHLDGEAALRTDGAEHFDVAGPSGPEAKIPSHGDHARRERRHEDVLDELLGGERREPRVERLSDDEVDAVASEELDLSREARQTCGRRGTEHGRRMRLERKDRELRVGRLGARENALMTAMHAIEVADDDDATLRLGRRRRCVARVVNQARCAVHRESFSANLLLRTLLASCARAMGLDCAPGALAALRALLARGPTPELRAAWAQKAVGSLFADRLVAMIRYRLRLQLHEYELSAGLTVVGRAPTCNLTIDDALLSREHAAVRLDGDRVTVRDLGSRNGTSVNGQPIVDDVELKDGDRVRIGTTEMVFSRVVATRRTLATTASFTTCRSCGSAHVARAACCPRCGENPTPTHKPRSASQTNRDFWLSLEVELFEKAVEMFRIDDAEEAVLRIQTKLDELLAINKHCAPDKLQTALSAVVRFAHIRGSGRKIGWVLDVLRKSKRLPCPELFALIASTPPIVLEESSDNLNALIEAHAARAGLSGGLSGPTTTDESCLRSLATLRDDMVAYGARRSVDTGTHGPVDALEAAGA